MSRKHELLNLMNIDTSWMKNIPNGKVNLLSFNNLELEAKNCYACPLSNTRNNVVFGKGNQKAEVLIVGEAPGKDEDLSGEPFVGRAGKLLNEILFSMKLSRDNVYITSIFRRTRYTKLFSCFFKTFRLYTFKNFV